MNPTFSSFSNREYCSQHVDSSSSFHTFEASIKLIEDILQKKVLCCHDVIHLTQAHHTVDQLENQSKIASHQDASSLLLKLSKRIEDLKDLGHASAKEIITAYHLQHFKIGPLDQNDVSFCLPMNLTLEKVGKIAKYLPFCRSGEQFEGDAKALIGENSLDIMTLLQGKKDRFHEYQERAMTLNKLREKNPPLYPDYFEEILHEELFHLYDHLIAMKALDTKAERSAAIENLSFSSFSNIILEFRKATFSKVDKILSQGSPNTVFLLGNTGSGKSTTLCYLRGDPMILQGGAYQSSTDIEHLIGNDTETSCTLFPNITVKEDLALVDFPGFADTHGEVISLAIELTLRALVRKYSPKIVLLTSITDTEARFTHIHLLGKRLERVLGTLDNCTLGLTKYSKDPDFMNIQAIEKRQKEELSSPSEEEKRLIQQIQTLEPFAETVPAIQAQIALFKGQLQPLQALRLSSSDQTLPDTEEKSKHYANLLQKEEAFKKHSGIKSVISLKDLTDQKQLEEILQKLSLQENTESIVVSNALDPADEKLLETLFIKNLSRVIQEKKNFSDASLITPSENIAKKIETFGQRILETSLINTLLESSHPEIGEFLHLESMDPRVVRQYDKKVITDCINGYIDEVISNLLTAEEIIKELKAKYPALKSQEAEREWSSLRDYILTLSKGISPQANPDKVKEAWESLQKAHQDRLNSSEKELKLSRGLEIILLIPFAIPYGIFSVFKKLRQAKISKEFMQDNIDKLYQDIKDARQAVINLKDIENTVKKKDQFDAVFSSYPLSLDSVSSLKESIQNQISQIEKIYGKEEWHKRVSHITNQLTSEASSVRPNSPLGETLLYMLISGEVSYQELPPYFNEYTFLAVIYSFLGSPLGSDLMSSTGKYQETLKQLFPDWKFAHYKNLGLSDPSYFFHTSSMVDQEYQLLSEQKQKSLESYHKNTISRLLFVDVISRLWKQIPLPINNNKKPGFFNSIKNDQVKILTAAQENAWILEYSKEHLRHDKEFILTAIQKNIYALRYASEALKNDREFVLTAVQQNGFALQYASEALKNNRDIVLTAVQQNGRALQFASEALKNDREFVLTAVQQNGSALRYASKVLKNDRKIVLAAIQQKGSPFLYASEALKNHREFVLAAVQQNGYILEYVNKTLKNDKEIVLAAVQQNGHVLWYASEALKNDKKFVLATIQQNGYTFEYVNRALRNDREFVLAAVKKSEVALKYVNEALKNDRELVFTAIQQNSSAFQYASEALKNDRRFVFAAIKQNGSAFQYASEALKNDRGFVLPAVQQNGLALEYVSEALKNDRKIVLTAVKENGAAFQYTSEVLKNDREFILAAVKENGAAFQCTSEVLKNDREFILAAVKENGAAFQYTSEVLKNDREFILAAVQQNSSAFEYASEVLKNDREFVLTAIQQNGSVLQYASEVLKNDRWFVLAAVQQNGFALQYASEALKNDRGFVFIAVKKNSSALEYASEALKNDREFVLAAVQENSSALEYASEALKNDREFVLAAVQENSSALENASEALKNDKEFVLVVVQQNGYAVRYIREAFKNDKEVVITAVRQNGYALLYTNEALKNDKEVVLTAVQQNGLALEYASEALKNDKEVVLAAVQQNRYALQYASKALKNDKEVVLTAVQQNGLALEYVSEALKNDKEVVLAAVQQNRYALQYASKALKNDKEIVLAATH